MNVLDGQEAQQHAAVVDDIDEHLLAEAIPEGIIFLDHAKQLCGWNRKAAHLFGLQTSQKGVALSTLFPNIEFQKLEQSESKLLAHPPGHPDMWVELKLRAYRDHDFILFISDKTAVYRLHAMREDFVANVSHELRTPITVFRGYLEILADMNEIAMPQLHEMVSHMASQSTRMERLVQDLMLLSKLESDLFPDNNHNQIAVASLIQTIYEDARSLSGRSNHEFILDLDENLYLMGQPEEIRSAFSNIIYNAVHYTPDNGRIEIRWYQDDKGKHFSVKDNGIGIAEKYLTRITQRFYRIDKSRAYRGKGGTGLGLAIVKHVLLRHGGELTINSKLHEGSEFVCSFKQ